jgi:hypothetical protein
MMSLGRFGLGLVLVGFLGVACGSDKSLPPPAGSAGAGQSGGSVRGGGDSSSNPEGGNDAQSEGGAGNGPPLGTIGGDAPSGEAGAPPNPPPSCDIGKKWGNPVKLSLSTPQADERLLSMTHDELSLVFSRDDQLFVADRSDPKQDFAAPVAVTLPSGHTFEHGVALSADGLTLVIVRTDQLGLAEVKRSERGKTFEGDASVARFSFVNVGLTQSGLLSSPVLARDGQALVLTRLEAADQTGLRLRGQHFDQVEQLDSVTFGAEEGKHKLSQSLSDDARTLFFFDEGTGHAAALGTLTPRAAFTLRADFPDLLSAFTNLGCGRLYGTLEVDGSLDLVVETPN